MLFEILSEQTAHKTKIANGLSCRAQDRKKKELFSNKLIIIQIQYIGSYYNDLFIFKLNQQICIL